MRSYCSLVALNTIVFFTFLGCCPVSLNTIKEVNNKYYRISNNEIVDIGVNISIKKYSELFDIDFEVMNSNDWAFLKKEIKLYATISRPKKVKVSYSDDLKLKHKSIDEGLQKTIRGLEALTETFFEIWYSFIFEPIFEENNNKYKMDKSFHYYYIEYNDGSSNTSTKLTKNLKYMESTQKDINGFLHLKANFESTNKGMLLAKFSMEKEKEVFLYQFNVKYKEINNYYLPDKVTIIIGTDGTKNDINLYFDNYVFISR